MTITSSHFRARDAAGQFSETIHDVAPLTLSAVPATVFDDALDRDHGGQADPPAAGACPGRSFTNGSRCLFPRTSCARRTRTTSLTGSPNGPSPNPTRLSAP